MSGPTVQKAQRLLTVPEPSTVRWIGDEVDPRRTGLKASALESIWKDVEALYATGLHPAVGLTLRHRGHVVLDRACGHVDVAQTRVVDGDTLWNVFSASKLVSAVLVMALVERDELRLDVPLSTYLPTLTASDATLRQLLMHRAGLHRMPPLGVSMEACLDEDFQLEALAQVRPFAPGWTAYSPMLFGVLLGQLVLRTQGCDMQQLASELLPDLGIRFGTDRPQDVAEHALTAPSPRPMLRVFRDTVGWPLDEAIEFSNSLAFKTAVLPSANVMGTGRDLTRFLQLLLNGGEIDGVRVLKERTVRHMVHERTPRSPDGTFGFPMRYGLGPMLGGDRMSLFGLGTRGAFGHLGLTTVVLYADPRRELCVALLNTGKPLLAPGFVRWYKALQRIPMVVPRSS